MLKYTFWVHDKNRNVRSYCNIKKLYSTYKLRFNHLPCVLSADYKIITLRTIIPNIYIIYKLYTRHSNVSIYVSLRVTTHAINNLLTSFAIIGISYKILNCLKSKAYYKKNPESYKKYNFACKYVNRYLPYLLRKIYRKFMLTVQTWYFEQTAAFICFLSVISLDIRYKKENFFIKISIFRPLNSKRTEQIKYVFNFLY